MLHSMLVSKKGEKEGSSEIKADDIWVTPISLPQIPLSPHAKDSQYPKNVPEGEAVIALA